MKKRARKGERKFIGMFSGRLGGREGEGSLVRARTRLFLDMVSLKG